MKIFFFFVFWLLCWATDEMKAQQTLVMSKREKSGGGSSSENKINRNGLIESKRIDKRRSKMFSELTTKSHLHDTTVGNLFTLRPALPFVVVSLSPLLRYFEDHLAPNAIQIRNQYQNTFCKLISYVLWRFFSSIFFHFLMRCCCVFFCRCHTLSFAFT